MKNIHAYIIIRDDNEKIISKKRANSFVKAIIDIIYTMNTTLTLASVVDTGGASRTIYSTGVQNINAIFRTDSGAGVVTHGIVVGSGTNAVAVSDSALQTPITHGSGSGQLSYSAMGIGSPLTSGSTRQYLSSRTLTNLSGAAVTVNEIALYMTFLDSAGTTRYFCIDRTLNTFSVPAASSRTVEYLIAVTV